MRRLAALTALLPCLAACSSVETRTVSYQEGRPAELGIEGIRNVAVAEFDGAERSGRIVSAKIAQGVVEQGAYRLFEREKVEEILAEHAFNRSGVVDPATVRALRLAGVDALVFGAVDAFDVEDQRGRATEERRVRTGEVRRIEYWDEDEGETRVREEDVWKTVLVEKPYLDRSGTLGVTFRLTDVRTGEVVAVEAMSATFRERAWLDGRASSAPTREEILDRLAADVVGRFLRKIQPHRITHTDELEVSRNVHSRAGADYAAAGLWDRAAAEFEIAAREEGDAPGAHFNLGTARFALGRYDEAVAAFERAIAIRSRQKYVNALARALDRRGAGRP